MDEDFTSFVGLFLVVELKQLLELLDVLGATVSEELLLVIDWLDVNELLMRGVVGLAAVDQGKRLNAKQQGD